MAAYKTCLSYLIKLLDEYNNTYHNSIGKKSIHADYCALIVEIESSHKASQFKVGDSMRNSKHKNIFSKNHKDNWF